MVICEHSRLCLILEEIQRVDFLDSINFVQVTVKVLILGKGYLRNYPYFKGYLGDLPFSEYFIIICLKKNIKILHPFPVIFPFRRIFKFLLDKELKSRKFFINWKNNLVVLFAYVFLSNLFPKALDP